ncbi:MAG: DUF1080 domain-containing protein [Terrimonas sp.]|nr:DUF1080 domain-containing protein [Terrimonas sp.]
MILVLLASFSLMSAFQAQQVKDNSLTKKEKKEGWVLLFDGQSTNGWRGYQNKEAKEWTVYNGELICRKGDFTGRADLITNDEYENFELSVDWKIDPEQNSGIIYMVTEDNKASYESGPEYQLIDDLGYPEKLKDGQFSGANYDMNPPLKHTVKKAGEYNHTVIIVNKGHVEHWLNGEKVVDYQLWTPEWEKNKANSKWKNVKTYGMSKSGHIALQDHGGGVSFKNIKLKKL